MRGVRRKIGESSSGSESGIGWERRKAPSFKKEDSVGSERL